MGLVAALTTAAQAADQACQLTELSSIDMRLDASGRPVIDVGLGGEDPVPMLVDTGGVYSMVTRETVTELELKPQHIPQSMIYMGATGEDIKSMVYVHGLQIGKIRADSYPFLVMPYGWDDPQTGGLIGPDILSSYDVEFDFGAKKLHLISPQHCPGQGVYWTKQPYMALPIRVDRSNQIHFTAMVDGKEMDAIFDSGASNTFMRLDIARSILGWTSNPPELVCDTKHDVCHYPFKSLSFGGVAVNNPEIYITPDKMASVRETGELHETQGRMNDPALILGTTVMRKLHLYIAYKEHMLYATGADTR
jgi:predicted aspartyl protease